MAPNYIFMKRMIVTLLFSGLMLSVTAQKGEALFFKSLSAQKNVDPIVKKASVGLYKHHSLINDSLLYYMATFEKAVLQGKAAGPVKPEVVRTAQKKYPGSDPAAVENRLKMYAKAGK
jgi:hypothetical protein